MPGTGFSRAEDLQPFPPLAKGGQGGWTRRNLLLVRALPHTPEPGCPPSGGGVRGGGPRKTYYVSALFRKRRFLGEGLLTPPECRLLGAGLLTPPECMTEGLLPPACAPSGCIGCEPSASTAELWTPPVGPSCGVEDPRRTDRGEASEFADTGMCRL